MSNSTSQSPPPSAEVMAELRIKMLSEPEAGFQAGAASSMPRVHRVLMDWPIGSYTATILASAVGDASIYTTSTFGVLGGIGHESVRAAAGLFVKAAEAHLDTAKLTKDFSYPPQGRVRFYMVSVDGTRMVEADEESLHAGTDSYSDLWFLGQQVMAELRTVVQNVDKGR